ncbi:MAG TPA: VCBS repeat-containing protein, partial [Thermoanaerobaculia bacterium]
MSFRRRLVAGAVVVLALVAGAWLYENASLTRLRRGYIPWMHRLERWRNAVEQTRRAIRSRTPTAADPAGVARAREWAWRDLDRMAYVSYRVERPTHEFSASQETTEGRVRFTLGGFRSDGTRIERSADLRVRAEWDPRAERTFADSVDDAPESSPLSLTVSVSLEKPVEERFNSSPRFHDATKESGLGAARQNPPLKLTNHLIGDIWPGSGVAVLDYNTDGFEDLFVADGVRSILYENDGKGHFTDVTVRAGLASADGTGIAATGVAAGDVDGDGWPDLLVTDAFGPTRLFRNRGDGT